MSGDWYREDDGDTVGVRCVDLTCGEFGGDAKLEEPELESTLTLGWNEIDDVGDREGLAKALLEGVGEEFSIEKWICDARVGEGDDFGGVGGALWVDNEAGVGVESDECGDSAIIEASGIK